MQQELIEMLEETISYVEVWHKEDQDVLDKAEALVEKAKNNNVPAVPQGVPAQEVIDSIEAWKSAWLKVPPFADRVNKATREAITISHNSLFLLLQSAQQAQRMPAACPTPTGCGPHGCHGACIAATPAPAPAQDVGLTDEEIDENTVWLDPDPHDNVHCDVSATVRKCLAALRAKENKL